MSDVAEQARAVELLILDVDGVLTDGRLYYGDTGIELKGFSTQDGAAIKMLLGTSVEVAIITGRRSELVTRRANELGIRYFFDGADDKVEAFHTLVARSEVAPAAMGHMGDDLPDLPLFNRVGLRLSVPGAHPVILDRADYVTTAPAGFGAVREACQLLMTAQGTWADALASYDR